MVKYFVENLLRTGMYQCIYKEIKLELNYLLMSENLPFYEMVLFVLVTMSVYVFLYF